MKYLTLMLLAHLAQADPLQSFHLTSSAFFTGQAIPSSYSYEGGNQIPPLSWWGEPSGTVQYTMVVFDSDAPKTAGNMPFMHWFVYAIPQSVHDMTGALLVGSPQSTNSFAQTGWHGPELPPGALAHHYIFAIYALDTILVFPLYGVTSAQVLTAMQGHVLAEATLTGTYQK